MNQTTLYQLFSYFNMDNYLNELDDIRELNDEVQIHWHLRDRLNPFTWYSSERFKIRFRLNKQSVGHSWHFKSRSGTQNGEAYCITSIDWGLWFIEALSGGSFHCIAGDVIRVHQSTIRPTVLRFSRDALQTKRKYFRIGNFPNVIESVDGIHVTIRLPSNVQFPGIYRHRKSSINVQVVCGPDHRFYNIVARWPGSTHDSWIFDVYPQSKMKV